MKVLQKIHTQIKESSKPLRIQGLLKKRPETLEEFLTKFFTKWNPTKSTVFVDDKQVQTQPGKRRSIADILIICRYYFPRCTLKQVSEVLYSFVGTLPHFRSSYCNTIHKRVFYLGSPDQASHLYDEGKADEFGLTVKDWKENPEK